ncbi:MAG TPA: membrane protein insertase YidC [Terricaulis sp.]|nr:membrane protein insertase YidC [Terricaulis sp.]
MAYRGGPEPQDTRNVFLAIGLSLAIFLGFEFFYNAPARERALAERAAVEETRAAQEAEQIAEGGAPAAPSGPVTREQAIASNGAGGRIVIETPTARGAIALNGGRFDDLSLINYHKQRDPASGDVTLLSPINSEYGHDAFFGWELQSGSDTATIAGADTAWSAPEGARLTPQTPVTLTLTGANGITLERTIAVDEHYMFTITEVVRNAGEATASVRPFGVVRRQGMPENYRNNPIVHQGLIGVFGEQYEHVTFQNADKHARDKARGRAGENERIEERQGQGGWFGITEHYWLAAMVPDQNERYSAFYDARPENNRNDYRAAYRGQWRDVPAGGEITYTQRFYAGAKEVELLQAYEKGEDGAQPIPRFDWAIDWGMFWFLTRPFFLWLLHPLGQWAGNFGIAILLSTIVIKALLFPLVYQSFKAMAKMRGLQPKMKDIQERYAADKQRQQQEMLKLYQTEKINPVAGCVPILLQIPVFYALYKTLTVTIEMRHAPFFGWIQDLSARDPTSIFNLFGLLPFGIPESFLGGALLIGAWPVLYGVSMWMLQALSPPPTDPIQKQIFGLLPFVFTILFSGFAAGLVIYWTWSNTLSILQQYVISRRQGVETQFDLFLKKHFGKDKDKPAPTK